MGLCNKSNQRRSRTRNRLHKLINFINSRQIKPYRDLRFTRNIPGLDRRNTDTCTFHTKRKKNYIIRARRRP